MADDRSLRDIIRFLDPSGDMSDADIAGITHQLKFTEVMDLISSVSNDNLDLGRNILKKYDDRFNIAQEYANAPGAQQGGFKPIKPIGSSPTIAGRPTNPNGQMGSDEEGELDALINDPQSKNKPEVKQIQSLLQRLQNR